MAGDEYNIDEVFKDLVQFPPIGFNPESGDQIAKDLLLVRLSGLSGQDWLREGDRIFCYCNFDTNTIIIFYCFGDKVGALTEEMGDLYPSDGLITQLRILRG